MGNDFEKYADRRKRGDRRSGTDRRSGEDRRSGTNRRSERDRRSNWQQATDQRFQGVLRATATISHLFSQPLTVITGYVDLLSASTEEKDIKEKLKIIKSQLEVINAYLENLRRLDSYKTIEFGGITLLDLDPSKKDKDR